jgi:uncharacterized protein YrrD
MVKLSELKGRAVIGLTGAHKLGIVDDALVSSSYDRLETLRIRPEGGGPDYLVSMDHVRSIGADAVTVDSQDSVVRADRATDLSRLSSLEAVRNSRVVTEGGDLLGSISEIDFAPDTGHVEAFEYHSGLLGGVMGKHHTVRPEDIIGVGRNIVTVKNAVGQSRAA